MEMNLYITFAVLAVLLAAVDFYCGHRAFKKTEAIGRYLGLSALLAGVVTLAYFYSIRTGSYFWMSVASSFYFACIDWMLVSLVRFVFLFTQLHRRKGAQIIRFGLIAYAVFDTVVLAVNIFSEIAIGYADNGREIASYTYQMKPLYVAHLAFTYLMVALVLSLLFYKSAKTPRQYRGQYLLIAASIILVVLVNAVFLFLDNSSPLSQLDWSVFGYSLGLLLCYWAAFIFRQRDMLKTLSMTIFQSMDLGIVLFDHTERLIMYNKKAAQMLPAVDFDKEMTCADFLGRCAIAPEDPQADHYSVRCERKNTRGLLLRCDYSRLRDPAGGVIGNLYVFSNVVDDTDIITGFQHNDTFKRFVTENPFVFDCPTTAVTFDLIGLSEVNRTFGREVGDQRIRSLSRLMREKLPPKTHFIRGHEAYLVAVCEHATERELLPAVEAIAGAASGTVLYGISEMEEGQGITAAIEAAGRSLQVKKLLNRNSFHSQSLSSLVRALYETDPDTEAHVRRTQKMGARLAQRIGLTDTQTADLQLLCLLHDIGKIGIPLEILNKPGKITDQEWALLQTHSEKGYQIAMSADELKSIAPMILYHHERWDGKGYPERLSGNGIPILSRIISVVDSYDAMVNNRSYRKGFPPEKAQEELQQCAGTQFDPNIVREFLDMLREDPEIAKGEKTGGDEVRVFVTSGAQEESRGNTFPIPYSRYLLDLDDVIIDVDRRFEEITGYGADEAIGKLQQFDIIPPEGRADYMLQVNNAFTRGNIACLKHEILRRDGGKVWVVCYGKRYFDSAAKAFRSEILIFKTTGGEDARQEDA